MIDTVAFFITDAGGLLAGEIQINPLDALPAGTVTPPPALEAGQYAIWSGTAWAVVEALPTPPAPDMPALRAAALMTAIAFGNRLTQPELAQWAGVEPLSWTQQRDEALKVKAGVGLDSFAVLPGLAEAKGIPIESYADDVLANAARYQVVLRAAISLRRRATNVLSDEALDTPEKLADAVAMLTVEANYLADQLLGGA